MKYTLGSKMIVKKSFWLNVKKSYLRNLMKNPLTSGRIHTIRLNCNAKMKKTILSEKAIVFDRWKYGSRIGKSMHL